MIKKHLNQMINIPNFEVMTIFDFDDYKRFLEALIETMPRKGYGQASKLAQALGVNSVVISQVLRGDKHFTVEQGIKVAKYFGLQPGATEFFLHLIYRERAGTQELKDYYSRKIEAMRASSRQLEKNLGKATVLSDVDKAVYYSNWYYSAIRLITTIEGFQDPDSIAKHFALERSKVLEILHFLVSRGLCVEEKGKFRTGIATTFIEKTSPLVVNHQRNWRLKGLEKVSSPRETDFFYSGPFSLSKDDAQTIRSELVELIARVDQTIRKSSEETLYCLNVDWFGF